VQVRCSASKLSSLVTWRPFKSPLFVRLLFAGFSDIGISSENTADSSQDRPQSLPSHKFNQIKVLQLED